jgi:GT2 family glycosyltransferase
MTDITVKRAPGASYALVTAAYNEEAYLEQTILSVSRQTILPEKWIIVSDGSTDQTDEIVRRYAEGCSFIDLYRITEEHPRNFAAQVNAINTGISRLDRSAYDFIGNLDADARANLFRSCLAEVLTKLETRTRRRGHLRGRERQVPESSRQYRHICGSRCSVVSP